jgi:hypothetical protein
MPEIRKAFANLRGEDKVDDAVQYCQDLLDREENRLEIVERKAYTLISVTGIAASFAVGFSGLVLSNYGSMPQPLLLPVAIVFVLLMGSLFVTAYLGSRVVEVGEYRLAYPSANDIFTLSGEKLTSVRLERAASLFYSFAHNAQVVNRKATYLIGGQLWFRNFIALLLLISGMIAFSLPFVPATGSPPAGVAQPTAQAVPKASPPIVTGTPNAQVQPAHPLREGTCAPLIGSTPVDGPLGTSNPWLAKQVWLTQVSRQAWRDYIRLGLECP